MPRRYPPETRRQVIELARAGTKVTQLVKTFGMTEATIYNWLRQDRIDRGEILGTSTDMALDLAAAKKRIRRHSALGMLTPTEYEERYSQTRDAA